MINIIFWLLKAIAIVVLASCLIITLIIGLYAIGQVMLGLTDKDNE